jgi:hypothetical protein
MFEKLANFRLFRPRHRTPQAYQAMAANDNLAITPRSGRQRRVRAPELTCHWSLDEGGTQLTCHWQARALTQLTREASENVQAGRARHRSARKQSNRPIDPTRTQTVRT